MTAQPMHVAITRYTSNVHILNLCMTTSSSEQLELDIANLGITVLTEWYNEEDRVRWREHEDFVTP